jgi:hypothetical protein
MKYGIEMAKIMKEPNRQWQRSQSIMKINGGIMAKMVISMKRK